MPVRRARACGLFCPHPSIKTPHHCSISPQSWSFLFFCHSLTKRSLPYRNRPGDRTVRELRGRVISSSTFTFSTLLWHVEGFPLNVNTDNEAYRYTVLNQLQRYSIFSRGCQQPWFRLTPPSKLGPKRSIPRKLLHCWTRSLCLWRAACRATMRKMLEMLLSWPSCEEVSGWRSWRSRSLVSASSPFSAMMEYTTPCRPGLRIRY